MIQFYGYMRDESVYFELLAMLQEIGGGLTRDDRL